MRLNNTSLKYIIDLTSSCIDVFYIVVIVAAVLSHVIIVITNCCFVFSAHRHISVYLEIYLYFVDIHHLGWVT